MAHHLVFIEAAVSDNRDKALVFKELDIEDHIQGCDGLPLSAEDSPSGNPGVLYAWRSKGDDQMIFIKDKQTWMKSPSGYWVGIWNDNHPTESQLRRPYMQEGEWINVCRGKEKFKLPIPLYLDKNMALQDDGTWKYVPFREHSWYYEEIDKRVSEMESRANEDGTVGMYYTINPIADIELIVRALRINYRIPPEVCHMTEMFTMMEVREIYGMIMSAGNK